MGRLLNDARVHLEQFALHKCYHVTHDSFTGPVRGPLPVGVLKNKDSVQFVFS